MTRKDYIVIAEALARVRPHISRSGLIGLEAAIILRQWLVTRDAIMGTLQRDNPGFDRVRFINATEV